MKFSVEEFLEVIEKAKNLITEKPTIVVKNATVTGVKLNSKIINSIHQSEEPIPFYEGIKVYQDDSLHNPHFIVEGEIETKKYLKWEDLDFKDEAQAMKVSLNGEIHFIGYWENTFGDKVCIINNNNITIREKDKDFFNDLHLEKVEEE